MNILDFAVRLGAALMMGVCVGLERQWRQRMAGTRTNALVAAGAAAFVMCGFMVRDNSCGEAQIVSYVVSGIGFLGAGVIFKDAGSVRGLNTAATIWCSAAIGALSWTGEFSSRFDSDLRRARHEYRSETTRLSSLSGSSVGRRTGSHLWIRVDLQSRRRSPHTSSPAASDDPKFPHFDRPPERGY